MFFSTVKAFLIASNLLGILALPGRREVSSCQIDLAPDTSDVANTTYVGLVKSATLASGTTYRYVFSPPFQPEKPYLLFLHGFPESSYAWENQINYFKKQVYGVIAPDLFLKNMATEIGDLLDCEGISQVIGIGHDSGSPLLSRLHTYQSNQLLALGFLDIGYFAPGVDLNENVIYALNNATATTLGYTIFGYWLFHNSEEAASIMDSHLDSVYTLAYTLHPTLFRDNFARVGTFETWLLEDKQAPIGSEYVSEVTKEQWKSIVRTQEGLKGPLKWYKSMIRGINTPDEQGNVALSPVIEQPVLLILADKDPVGVPSYQANSTVPYAVHLEIRSVNSGHFVQVEKAR